MVLTVQCWTLLTKIKWEIFLHPTFQLKHRAKEKQEKLEYQSDHLLMLIAASVENLLTYLLVSISLALSCLDGTITKTCKTS